MPGSPLRSMFTSQTSFFPEEPEVEKDLSGPPSVKKGEARPDGGDEADLVRLRKKILRLLDTVKGHSQVQKKRMMKRGAFPPVPKKPPLSTNPLPLSFGETALMDSPRSCLLESFDDRELTLMRTSLEHALKNIEDESLKLSLLKFFEPNPADMDSSLRYRRRLRRALDTEAKERSSSIASMWLLGEEATGVKLWQPPVREKGKVDKRDLMDSIPVDPDERKKIPPECQKERIKKDLSQPRLFSPWHPVYRQEDPVAKSKRVHLSAFHKRLQDVEVVARKIELRSLQNTFKVRQQQGENSVQLERKKDISNLWTRYVNLRKEDIAKGMESSHGDCHGIIDNAILMARERRREIQEEDRKMLQEEAARREEMNRNAEKEVRKAERRRAKRIEKGLTKKLEKAVPKAAKYPLQSHYGVKTDNQLKEAITTKLRALRNSEKTAALNAASEKKLMRSERQLSSIEDSWSKPDSMSFKGSISLLPSISFGQTFSMDLRAMCR